MARPNSQPCAICRTHKRRQPFKLKADNGERFEITHICNCPFCGRFLEENYKPLTAEELEEENNDE